MKKSFSIIEDARRTARHEDKAGESRKHQRIFRSKKSGRDRRKRGRKHGLTYIFGGGTLWIPALLLTVILLLLLSRFFRGCGTEKGEDGRGEYRFSPRDSSALSGRAEEEESDEPSSRPIPVEEQDPLLLVNKDHPLPAEYVPETAALRYGMASSRLCLDDLQAMMDDCRAAGLRPLICSSYRSYEKQEELWRNKVKFYQDQGKLPGEAVELASRVVAPPGESEHQTGLAFDIVDEGYQLLDEKQESTKVSLWLRENAVRYGFIVRYPPEKTDVTGIIYEPWHYRYVGKENAREISSSGLTLEEYLSVAGR